MHAHREALILPHSDSDGSITFVLRLIVHMTDSLKSKLKRLQLLNRQRICITLNTYSIFWFYVKSNNNNNNTERLKRWINMMVILISILKSLNNQKTISISIAIYGLSSTEYHINTRVSLKIMLNRSGKISLYDDLNQWFPTFSVVSPQAL